MKALKYINKCLNIHENYKSAETNSRVRLFSEPKRSWCVFQQIHQEISSGNVRKVSSKIQTY